MKDPLIHDMLSEEHEPNKRAINLARIRLYLGEETTPMVGDVQIGAYFLMAVFSDVATLQEQRFESYFEYHAQVQLSPMVLDSCKCS